VKPTVLIVDDSLTVRMDLNGALESAGFVTTLCATLAEARQALSRDSFGLVILDVLLPDGDGIAFLREMKGATATAKVPVMLLSSEAEVRNRVRGLKTGAHEYVGKPYDQAYVVARARELLRQQGFESRTSRSTTVLLIDDSPTFREQLKSTLESAGYEVLTAGTGEDGLRLAVSERPVAIVVDGILPGIDGATVIRRIRADAILRRTPCILLTASEEQSGEISALDAGADDYVRKEEDAQIILARLAAIIRTAKAPSVAGPATSMLDPKRILAVDDSLTYLEEVATRLRMEGYDVVTARSGEEAIELLSVQIVDCILLDLVMPGLSGHETCRRIKSSKQWRDIPLIMHTAQEGQGAFIEGMNAGADDYTAKSNDIQVLCARVRAQMRRKQFEDENRNIREQFLQKEMESAAALRRSEANFRSLVDHAPVGIYRSSATEDRFLAVNPALVKMLGYSSADEVMKLKLSRDVYLPAGKRTGPLEPATGEGSFMGTELHWQRKDGTPVTVRTSGSPICNERGELVAYEVVAEDITEYKSLEQQFRQAQKMEAVGRLAGGVAHDFNNLLMIVNGCAELMLKHTSDPRVQGYGEKIIAAGLKAVAVVRQLLAFSRKQVFESRVLDLNQLLRDFTKLLPPLIGEDLEMIFVTGAENALVNIDPGQTEQVVMNLVVNARDAMPRGGKVVIETSNVELDASYAKLHPETLPGSYVMLAVSDTGTGMDANTRERIFEPFFTTKETGKGTGLGLSTVFGIIKQIGGFVSVYSEIGKGTIFKVYFPRAVQSAIASQLPSKPASIPTGTETVLLVEDEDGLRALTREFLESIGYTVLESANGAAAFAVSDKHQGPIHVILTDLVMPGLRGPEVAGRLKKSYPDAQTIFMSGYSDHMPEVEELGPDAQFLQKPFDLAILAQKLRTVLEKR